MKFMNKLLSAVTAAAMGISMVTAVVGGFSTASAADMTAVELVEDMGLGWNLGNSMSCSNTWTTPLTPEAIETAWGNPVTTEAMIKEVKKSGFKTIRIPVTWYQAMNGEVSMDDYLARVKEIVDYCINNGLYAIIDTHMEASWLTASNQSKFTDLWKTIANYFKDYDEHLVFEGMNEIDISDSDIATLNQAFVDTVRATGGNNADRLLLVPAANNNTAKLLSSAFTAPEDSANMIAVSCHYYEPPTFCVAELDSTWGYASTWGTSADYTILENDFKKLKEKFVDNGIPVIVGEYGVVTDEGKDDASMKKFLEAVASTAYDMTGVCPVVWDDSNGGTIKYFNRQSLSWYDPEIQQIFVDVANGSSGGNDKEKTDRVTMTGEELTNEDGDILFDLSPYKELGVSVSSVVVDYELVSSKGNSEVSAGLAMSFNVIDDTTGETVWAYLQDGIGISDTVYTFNFPSDNYYVLETDSKTGEVTSDVTGALDMDYLKFEKWWDWSSATGDKITLNINSITVIFDDYFYVDGSGEQTTTEPAQTTATEDTTANTTTTTTTTTEPSGESVGQIWIAGQAGTYQFWSADSDGVIPVNITGNGTYTASYILPEGDGTGSIECLILDSDINLYQFLPEDYDGTDRVADCGVTFNIEKIALDQVELPYTGPTDGSMCYGNDGVSLRRNILNTWTSPKISDIDGTEVSLTQIIEVTFTVSGIPGGSEVTTTEPEETTTTTTEVTTTTTESATTTTTTSGTTTTTTSGTTVSGNPDAFYGDVNLDAKVDLTDAILLNKYCADAVIFSEQALLNGDCDASGNVDTNDAIVLLRFLVHLVDALPSAS